MLSGIFQNRKSIRRYRPDAIDETIMKKLLDFSKRLPVFTQEIKHQFVWVHGKDWISDILSSFLLSYGKMISSPYMIVPFYSTNKYTNLEIGYQLEHLVLFATELGLGTLWLSAEEAQKQIIEEVRNLINDPGDESPKAARLVEVFPENLNFALNNAEMPVILLLGLASEKRMDRIISNAVRMESAGNSRKKIDSIVSNCKVEQIPSNLKKLLNLAILAPSKKNQQPWRVRFTKKGFDVGFLHERELDFGIFLAHLEIGMNDLSIPHQFHIFYEKSNDVEWVVKVQLG